MVMPILVLSIRDVDFTDDKGDRIVGKSVNFAPIVTDEESGAVEFTAPDKAFFKGKAASDFGAPGFYSGAFSLVQKGGNNVLKLVGGSYLESLVIPSSVVA